MPVTSTEAVFLPYLNAGDGLTLRLVSATVDGRVAEVRWDADAAGVDLFELGNDWQEAVLAFAVSLDSTGPKISEMVPTSERVRPNVELLSSLHSARTYRRWATLGNWDFGDAKGTLAATIRRSEVSGTVELRTLLVRSTTQAEDSGLASEKGARLAWSRDWRIHIDRPQERAGPGLPTIWEEFRASTSRWRREHAELLFHLDTTPDQPTLFLNSGIDPDLQAVLKEEAPRGRNAAARDVIFAAIASSVWWGLVVEAERTLPTEGLPDAGWRRNVLEKVADTISPDLSGEEALEKLTNELRDPNGGTGVRERVAAAVLQLTKLRGFAETLVRELA